MIENANELIVWRRHFLRLGRKGRATRLDWKARDRASNGQYFTVGAGSDEGVMERGWLTEEWEEVREKGNIWGMR